MGIDSDIFRKGKILVMKMGNLSCPMCTSLLSKLGKLEKQYRSYPIKFLDISFEGDTWVIHDRSSKGSTCHEDYSSGVNETSYDSNYEI